MSRSADNNFPVTVTQLPVTRCQLCERTVAYRPGEASAALTKHYELRHKDALGLSPVEAAELAAFPRRPHASPGPPHPAARPAARVSPRARPPAGRAAPGQ